MRLNKYFFIGVAAFIMAALSFTASAREKVAAKMYVFGVATSFNDSVAYVTDIHELDSVEVSGKLKFLVEKQEYSYQLKSYMSEHGMPHRTCVTVSAPTLKAINKEMLKMRQRLVKKGHYVISNLSAADFKYERVVTAE